MSPGSLETGEPPGDGPAPDERLRHIRNALHGGGKFLVPTISALLATAVVFRRIGASDFGIYSLAIAVVSFGDFAQIGAGPAIVKYVAEIRGLSGRIDGGKARIRPLLRAGHVFSALAFGFVAVLAFGFVALGLEATGVGPERHEFSRRVFLWATLASGLNFFAVPYLSVYEGLERYDISARIISARAVLTATTDVIIIILTGSLPLLLAARVADNGLLLLVASRVERHTGLSLPRDDRRERGALAADVRRLAGFGIHLSVASVSGLALTRGTYFIVGAYLGTTWTGIYSLVNEFAIKAHRLLSSVYQFVFPATSRLLAIGRPEDLQVLLRNCYRLAILVIFPLVVSAWLVSPLVLGLVFGGSLTSEEESLAFAAFSVLLLSYYLYGISSIEYGVVNGSGAPRVNRDYNLLLAAGTLGLAASLIGMLGAIGAVVSGAAIGLGAVLYIGFASRRFVPREAGFFRPYVRVAAVTLFAGAGLYALDLAVGAGPLGLVGAALLVPPLAVLAGRRAGTIGRGEGRSLARDLFRAARTGAGGP